MRSGYFILWVLFLAMASCKNSSTSDEPDATIKNDWFNLHGCSCCQMSESSIALTAGGAFEGHEMLSDSSFILKWGRDKENLRVIPDTFYCRNRQDMTPKIIDENENYLVTRNRCGSECAELRFLPLIDSVDYYSCAYVFDYDIESHLVAHLDYLEVEDKIKVINLKSNEIQFFELSPSCMSAMTYYCVDSLSVKGGDFYLRWDSELTEDKSNVIEIRKKLP